MSNKLISYRVLREHDGDRFYREGETREANPKEVAHLVGRVLKPIDSTSEEAEPEPGAEGAKAEPAPQNKAEGAAPANKASAGRKAK